ncbi:MAG: hypothetical protein ACI8S3_000383 [Alphaproteobacteria bacterium]|jgi:hypothetical protein
MASAWTARTPAISASNRLGLVWAVVLDNIGPRQLEQTHGMRHGTARKVLAEALWRYAEISGIWRGRRWEEKAGEYGGADRD